MLYLLYGPDTYSSRQKLRELEAAFKRKSGELFNVTRIDLEDAPDSVSELGRGGSLFSAHQLFIIERAGRAPKAMTDRIHELAAVWANDRDTLVIFWEADAGEKGSESLNRIRKLAEKTQEFKVLPPAKVLARLDAEAKQRNLKLSPVEKKLLVNSFGSDLWALANELDKIQAGAAVQDRREEQEKIWNFTDAFFLNRRTAILPLVKLLEAGFEALYLLGALARALETLALVSWGLAKGNLGRAVAHLHPYVVKKNTELARRLNGMRLRQYYAALLRADLEVKTGRLPLPLPLLKLVLKVEADLSLMSTLKLR